MLGRVVCVAVLLAASCPPAASAGPVEFARGEVERALAERRLPPASLQMRTEVRPGPPESFEVFPDRVIGADERGLMYGLLTAADQVRAEGEPKRESGAPRTPMRGVRQFLHNESLEENWYHSREHWNAYFAMLARNRFNRFNLVFAHQTDYLAPPYPFWLDLRQFPGVTVPGLSAERRRRNLETLCFIARAAADHGVAFTLGIWQHDVQRHRGMRPAVVGLTPANIGPYSYAALRHVLATCDGIEAVQLRTNDESGIPPDRQLAFYRDHVFAAIRDSGRPVTLDLRGWAAAAELVEAARQAGVPLRVSAKYWAEHLGRPYQPAETYPGYSYENLLRKPHPYRFFWELWGLGSHRLLLWGNPDYVRRAVPTFRLGGAEGFEIDLPLAQKGYGNRPGKWGVFTPPELARRRSWTWEWQRYWLFYALWGRLSYDPGTDDRIWEAELARRVGAAAGPDVMAAYRNASQILNELVAVNLADPNMYIWPEINPGGPIDAYKDTPPSDRRYVATFSEAAGNRMRPRASAKRTPAATAARLDGWADAIEAAVTRARSKVGAGNRDWLSSEPDFVVLAALARYHARKQLAADALAWFDATGDAASLTRARHELEAGLRVWEELARFTDGLYPDGLAFGPDDVGHWKDKLPYVRHDLRLVADREAVLRRFGRFDVGFDFGAPVPGPHAPWSTVAPRFLAVDPDTRFTAARGHGWSGEGRREALAIPPTPYLEARAVAANPTGLPTDVLLRDAVRGQGAQSFVVATGPGDFAVTLVDADGATETRRLQARDGRLTVTFPDQAWSVSALVVNGPRSRRPLPRAVQARVLPRPVLRHEAPPTCRPGQPLVLTLEAPSADGIRAVCLHYRAVNQRAAFRTLTAPPSPPFTFTIPGPDIRADADLMYYFEVLHDENGGWFQPDPEKATPYYVVVVQQGGETPHR